MPSRRRARELALGALYSAVAADEPPEEPIAASCVRHRMPDDLAGFATRLALRAWERREAHDAAIAAHATHWEPERLVRIDRLILWLALTELHDFPEVPVRVVIDEALGLAHKYSGAGAPAFINGVLDARARALGLLAASVR